MRMSRTAAALLAALALAAPASARAGDDCDSRTVREGDSLWSIARECGISVRALRHANDLDEDDVLRAGDRLHIPPPRGSARDGEGAADDSTGDADDGIGTAHDRARTPDDGEHVEITLHRMHSDEEITVRLFNDDGDLRSSARTQASHIFRHVSTDREIPVSTDLLALLQRVADHWPGRTVYVHSAVRPVVRRPGKPLGNHMLGRALDFHLDGVTNEDLRDFCRTLDHAGVGYYPNSTFVHLDAREDSWYWIDVSGPGEAAQYVDPDLYEETDQERSQEGEWSPEAAPASADAPPAEPAPETDTDGAPATAPATPSTTSEPAPTTVEPPADPRQPVPPSRATPADPPPAGG
ncbi:MAG: DUF882 domain-containing protein [Deltaproteobacteria bacterium]|nr:DUF882 domain-containing protein [Deltaproteobacteria bacterium]